ncbi:unnamed protein product, partial [Polarella glacialis]
SSGRDTKPCCCSCGRCCCCCCGSCCWCCCCFCCCFSFSCCCRCRCCSRSSSGGCDCCFVHSLPGAMAMRRQRRVSSAAGLGLVVACLLLGCSTFVPAPTVKAPESLLAARLGGVLGGLGLSLKSGAAWAVTEGYEDYNNIKERMLAKSVPQEIEKAASKGPDMTAATTVGGAGFFILVALAGIVILLVSGKRDTTIRDQANGKRG